MTSVRAQLHSSGPQREINEITTVALWGTKSVRIQRGEGHTEYKGNWKSLKTTRVDWFSLAIH